MQTRTRSETRCLSVSRDEALRLFPIGTLIEKPHQGRVLKGQVYDYSGRHWRLRYQDNDWEELSRRELEQLLKK